MDWHLLTEQHDRILFDAKNAPALAEAGILRPDSIVWHEGLQDWVECSALLSQSDFGDPKPFQSVPIGLDEGLIMCGECKALSRISSSKCWICGKEIWKERNVPLAHAPAVLPPPLPKSAAGQGDPVRSGRSGGYYVGLNATILSIVGSLVVMWGIYNIAPGFALIAGILFFPALLAILIPSLSSKARPSASGVSENQGATGIQTENKPGVAAKSPSGLSVTGGVFAALGGFLIISVGIGILIVVVIVILFANLCGFL